MCSPATATLSARSGSIRSHIAGDGDAVGEERLDPLPLLREYLLEVALDEGRELGDERSRPLEQQGECLARGGKVAHSVGEQLCLGALVGQLPPGQRSVLEAERELEAQLCLRHREEQLELLCQRRLATIAADEERGG